MIMNLCLASRARAARPTALKNISISHFCIFFLHKFWNYFLFKNLALCCKLIAYKYVLVSCCLRMIFMFIQVVVAFFQAFSYHCISAHKWLHNWI